MNPHGHGAVVRPHGVKAHHLQRLGAGRIEMRVRAAQEGGMPGSPLRIHAKAQLHLPALRSRAKRRCFIRLARRGESGPGDGPRTRRSVDRSDRSTEGQSGADSAAQKHKAIHGYEEGRGPKPRALLACWTRCGRRLTPAPPRRQLRLRAPLVLPGLSRGDAVKRDAAGERLGKEPGEVVDQDPRGRGGAQLLRGSVRIHGKRRRADCPPPLRRSVWGTIRDRRALRASPESGCRPARFGKRASPRSIG